MRRSALFVVLSAFALFGAATLVTSIFAAAIAEETAHMAMENSQ